MTLAARTLIACRSRGWRLAVAESCTGGLITASLTDVPGSSDVLDRGYVTYSNLAKTQMLGVSPETLEAFGAVSPEVAEQMAQGALAQANVEIAIAVTGIAGPGGSEFKPEGMVCLGLAQQGLDTETKTLTFGALGRSVVRARSVEAALEWVLNAAEPT